MLTIIIPMAGRGSRFKAAGYELPKPFIDVCGLPMVERVRANLPRADKLIIVALEEHAPLVRAWLARVDAEDKFNYAMGIHATYIPEVTAGAACTVYGVIDEVHPESELLVANSDQWLDWSPDHFIDYCRRNAEREYVREGHYPVDGVIPTFTATGPKWSYLDLRDNGTVRRVVEKQPISDVATCGVYWWRMAKDCFDSIEMMVMDNDRTLNEFYLAPTFNRLIEMGGQFISYPVPRMVGMGMPADLQAALLESKLHGWEAVNECG